MTPSIVALREKLNELKAHRSRLSRLEAEAALTAAAIIEDIKVDDQKIDTLCIQLKLMVDVEKLRRAREAVPFMDEVKKSPDANEVIRTMEANKWVAELGRNGVWVVGTEESFGINALGMGGTFLDAFEMAKKCAA